MTDKFRHIPSCSECILLRIARKIRPENRRRMLFISLFLPVIALVVSCDESRSNNEAHESAERLMKEHPDSSMAILEAINPETMATAEGKARHALLLSRARHRCGIRETDDSLITTAAEYYTRHPAFAPDGTSYKMLALYHQGVVRENDNNLIMALQSYLKAEAEAVPLEDHYFLGYIYRHFCLLYENIHAGKESVHYGKKSFEEFTKAGSEADIAYSANELGKAFSVYCEHDSALTWANKCLALPFAMKDTLLRAEALRVAGRSCARLGRFGEAIDYYRQLQSLSPSLFGEKDAAELAKAFHATGRDREAYGICREYLGADTTLANVPYEILYSRGEIEAAFNSIKKILHNDSRASVINARQNLTRALTAFREQEIINEVDRREKNQTTWILGTSLILALCVIIFLILSNCIKRNRKALDDAMLKMEGLNNDLRGQLNTQKALLNEKEQVSRNLDRLTREHEQLKIDLERQENEKSLTISNYCQLLEFQIQQIEEMTRLYANEPTSPSENKKLVKRISRLLDNCSNPKFMSKMEQEANRFHDDIVIRFRDAFPELRDEDTRLFLYQVFGFSGRTISFLLNEDLTVVYSRRSRLKAKIAKSESPDRDLFLSFFS